MNGWNRPIGRRTLDVTVLVFDALVVAGPVVVLAIVQFLAPDGTKVALTHVTGVLTPLSLFGHAFVHFSTADLVWNVLGYVVLGLLAYALAIWLDERLWFLLSLVSVLLVVPAVSGGVDEILFAQVFARGPISIRGFSGVVAGTAGLVFVLYLGAIRRLYGPVSAATVGALGVAWFGTVLEVIYSPATIPRALMGLVVALALLITVAGRRTSWSPGPFRRGRLARALLAGVPVALVLTASTVLLFPADPFAVGPTTNVYSHAVGFFTGVVVSIWGHRYWAHLDWT